MEIQVRAGRIHGARWAMNYFFRGGRRSPLVLELVRNGGLDETLALLEVWKVEAGGKGERIKEQKVMRACEGAKGKGTRRECSVQGRPRVAETKIQPPGLGFGVFSS